MEILEKGLSFVPTYKGNRFETTVECFRFFRSLRLKQFFNSNEGEREVIENTDTMTVPKTLKLRSTFSPQITHSTLETYIRLVQADIKKLNWQTTPRYMNLKAHDVKFLQTLGKDTTLTIKPADKGGALVIMNTSQYVFEINRQLSDTSCYQHLDSDPTDRIKRHITDIVKVGTDNGWINEETSQFLLMKKPTIPVMYTLPKIHKSLINPPGRPIVSGSDSLLQPLGVYLDSLLQPLASSTPSYLRDTTDFLSKLESLEFKPEFLLACFDVQSLYTSIPNNDGMSAVRWICEINNCTLGSNTDFSLLLLDTVLNQNYFRFQDKYYLQIKGTAMGANMAPAYAVIYMSWFERTKILCNLEWCDKIVCWWRYIDNIFVVWRGNRTELDSFSTHLNTLDGNIKFTLETANTSVNFLDTRISISPGGYASDLFTKPTDTNSLLLASSFHPHGTINGLPFSQFLRVRRIVNEPEKVETRMTEMLGKFCDRGYDPETLISSKTKALEKTRTSCLSPKPKKTQLDKAIFVSTYSCMSSKVRKIVLKHWSLLQSDPSICKTLQTPPMFSFTRHKNLRDYLVKADTLNKELTQSFLATPKRGTYPCLSCVNCNNVIKGDYISHPRSGSKIKISGYFTCDSQHVVYMLKCPCGSVYVGKTIRPVKKRICEHKSAIRNRDVRSPVARHFAREKHNVAQLRFLVLEQVDKHPRGGDRERRLLQRESFWIESLDSLEPFGLNETVDFNCFLPVR